MAVVGADCRCWCNQLCFFGEREHPSGGVGGEKWVRTSRSCFADAVVGLTKPPKDRDNTLRLSR